MKAYDIKNIFGTCTACRGLAFVVWMPSIKTWLLSCSECGYELFDKTLKL